MAKVSYPQTDAEKAKLYLHCMMEIKLRLGAVGVILERTDDIPLFKQEAAYLHLRHVCELIAIACLAAQGDYKTQRAFTEEYSPGKIFKALRKVYPNSFPEPARMTTKGNHHHVERLHLEDAYQVEDVISLWDGAGAFLHRASVSRYLKTTFNRPPPDLEPIRKHRHGLMRLLDHHIVPIEHAQTQPVFLQVNMDIANQGIAARFLRLNMADSTIAVEEFQSFLG